MSDGHADRSRGPVLTIRFAHRPTPTRRLAVVCGVLALLAGQPDRRPEAAGPSVLRIGLPAGFPAADYRELVVGTAALLAAMGLADAATPVPDRTATDEELNLAFEGFVDELIESCPWGW